MSFLTTISHKLGKTITPLEIPEIHQLPTSGFETSITENLSTLFQPTNILRVTKGVIVEPQVSPNLLFSIPEIETQSSFKIELESSVSDDLLESFSDVWVSENLSLSSFNIWEETSVSENLFKHLFPERVNGKNYEKKAKQQPKQYDFFSAKAKSASDGFRKAYKREKTQGSISSYVTDSLTFWDLLYPVLLPPLNVNFKSQFELYQPLFKFQPAGIEFLVKNKSALLADEMGTGKTVMSSVALKILFRLGKVKRALIVCPVSLLRTWQEHLTNWASELELTVVRGTPEVRKLDWKYNAHVYLTTYDTVASDFLTKIKKHNKFVCPNCKLRLNLGSNICVEDENMPTYFCPECRFVLNDYLIENLPKKSSIVDAAILNSFDVVLIDEAQYIKNRGSDRSRAVRLLKPNYKWALTGTPIENRLDDLVAIFSFVKPNLFKNEFLTPKRAAALIEPHFLRRLKKDVMKDLPPKVKQEIWLQLDEDQKRAYKAAEQLGIKEIEELGGRVTKVHIFSLISKLKQICNFSPNKERSSKTEELLDLVEQIKESGQKVLIFSQYDIEGVSKLEKLLAPFGVSVLKGGMNDYARNAAIDKFKRDPNICVFLATIKTGGVGLTLTEASYVIHFDHWWNPALMWQADDRVHRSGQKSSQVNIYSFWMQDTIEERIHTILKEKGLLFDEVINGLSVEAIDEMISTEEWLNILGIKSNKQTSSSSQAKGGQHQSNRNNRRSENSNQQANTNNGDGRSNYNRKQKTEPPEIVMSISAAHNILGVKFGIATKEEIVAAYRRMARIHHPDKVVQASPLLIEQALEKMKQINAAYEVLKKHKYV